MNTTSDLQQSALPQLKGGMRSAHGLVAQPCIYSFRCSRGMEESMSRLMLERNLNRTSVIRLALYALDCFSRRQEVSSLSLVEFVEQLAALSSPDARTSFEEFIRGK